MNDLISRKAAIDALISESRIVDGHYTMYERIIIESDAIEAISMLPSAQQWIPVSEQLPMKTDEYLVCYNNGDVSTDWYGFTDDGLINGFDEDIIAWMFLPKRYEEY